MVVTLTQKTMRRIYAIWVARALISPIFLKLYAIALVLFGIAQYVSFRSVFENAPVWNNVGAQFTFARSAVLHTESLTLFFIFISVVIFMLLCNDIFVYVKKDHARVVSL